MTYETIAGAQINGELIANYFKHLVNRFFKILPIREGEEESLPAYMRSLQIELLGCRELLPEIKDNPDFLRLPSTLQYLIDHPDCDLKDVRREVFQAINLCNRLHETYERGGDGK